MAAPGRLLRFCLIWALLLPLAAQANAAGAKTIVLLDVEGEKTPRLRKSLERMVKTQHKILVASVYRDAARRLRAEKLTPNNVKKVCAYLQAEGVVDGVVVADQGRYRFVVRLRSGSDGTITKKIPLRLNRPSLGEGIAAEVEERLLGAIDVLPGLDGRGSDRAVASKVRKSRKKDGAARPGRSARRGKAAGIEGIEDEDEDEDDVEGADDGEDEDETVAAAPRRSGRGKRPATGKRGRAGRGASAEDDRKAARDDAEVAEEESAETDDDEDAEESRRTAMKDGDEAEGDEADARAETIRRSPGSPDPRTAPVLIHVGISVVGRKLSFDHSGDAEDAPRGYSGTPVPGAYLVGEVYPLLLAGQRGPLANVGVGFVADRVFKLDSAIDDGAGGSVSLATQQSRYGVNLRYRYNFGPGRDSATVYASLGYNKASFSISQEGIPATATLDVPNVGYTYVDPGLGARIPVTGPLSFLVEAKFLAPLDTGQIQTGEHYGEATVQGYDADIGFEYQLGERLLARAGARLLRMGYEFSGSGALSDRNGDGEEDVTGASDRYLGGYLTGGYIF